MAFPHLQNYFLKMTLDAFSIAQFELNFLADPKGK